MPIYDVDVEITYRGVVTVEARTFREAMAMAERGPGAWLNGTRAEAEEHRHTEAVEAHKQGGENEEEYADAMQAWRDRQTA